MRPPMTIVLAALLGVLYGLVLGAVGVRLLVEYHTGTGQIGAEHLVGRGAAGLTVGAVLFFGAGVSLAIGGVRLLVRRVRALLLAPLVVILAIGVVGEIVGIATGESAASNLTGLGILTLAALPIVLLSSPSGRRWLRPLGPRPAGFDLKGRGDQHGRPER